MYDTCSELLGAKLTRVGTRREYRAFVAFSGGGAKGIVHIGALKALEERNVEFLGLSGTSAGSIIATLAAAGFTADEIANPGAETSILNKLTAIDPKLKRMIDVFGGGWVRVAAFRWCIRRLGIWPLVIAWVLPSITAYAAWHTWPHQPLVGAVLWLLASLVVWWCMSILLGGLTHLKQFRDAFACLLQERIFPEEPGRVVTIGDFGTGGRPSLKIVSANLTRRALHLFSPDRTPNVAVADAVAASICLPVIFQPWAIDGEHHVDGGIVSNLPAWPFDEERELDTEALTIAVEISEPPAIKPLRSGAWLSAAIRTTLSGSAELNIRLAGQVEQLALPTQLDLLDFDAPPATIWQEVRDVTAAAGVRLDKRLFRLPELYRNACSVAQSLAIDALSEVQASDRFGRIRVAAGRLERGYTRSLRFSHGVGFGQDADQVTLISLEGTVAGAAWQSGQSQFEIVHPSVPSKQRDAAKESSPWPDLAWLMCIPILDTQTGKTRLVVRLEGDFPLAEALEMSEALNVVEQAVNDFFAQILDELRELED